MGQNNSFLLCDPIFCWVIQICINFFIKKFHVTFLLRTNSDASNKFLTHAPVFLGGQIPWRFYDHRTNTTALAFENFLNKLTGSPLIINDYDYMEDEAFMKNKYSNFNPHEVLSPQSLDLESQSTSKVNFSKNITKKPISFSSWDIEDYYEINYNTAQRGDKLV